MHWLLYIALCVYNWVDYVQTVMLIESGLAFEANPLVAGMISLFGFKGILIFKAMWLIPLAIGLWWKYHVSMSKV